MLRVSSAAFRRSVNPVIRVTTRLMKFTVGERNVADRYSFSRLILYMNIVITVNPT